MAFAVMGYHLTSYEGIGTASRIDFYAVYAFFVISGFSLYIAYRDRLATLVDVKSYLIRRFFRIPPLFYTAIVLELLIGEWQPDLAAKLLVNLTPFVRACYQGVPRC